MAERRFPDPRLPDLRLPERGALVLLTDFGVRDGAVAAMKGVALSVDPGLTLVDLTHEIPPFDIWEGAFRLRQSAPYWPAGTVFVAVVDPGVGTARKSVAARDASGRLYVAPDNGLLTFVAQDLSLSEVRDVDEERFRLPGSDASYTFLGRDLYAHLGARLACGQLTLAAVGEALPRPPLTLPHEAARVQEGAALGGIPALDPQFGNVWTDIDARLLDLAGVRLGDSVEVALSRGGVEHYREVVPFVKSFGVVAAGERLLYLNSLLRAALAVNCASFAARYDVQAGRDWTVRLRRAP